MELYDTSGALHEVPLDGTEGEDRPYARSGHSVRRQPIHGLLPLLLPFFIGLLPT